MKNEKIFITLILIILLHGLTFGQESNKQRTPFKPRIFYGGGFGLQFGNTTLIEVSPSIGVELLPNFGIGVTPTYKYYRYRPYYTSDKIVTNVYGGSIFARYVVVYNIFLHAEYEKLFFNTKSDLIENQKQDFDSFLVGGGYRQQVGEKTFVHISILWNLNDSQNSLYNNPVIRMGLGFGF
ncbi:MAG: hypothetical protein ACOXZ9_00255 [Bacteroidales bacterium]|jgi:hypothetical protein